MENLIGKVALVTGASSGIGKTIAIALVEEGMTVIGAARRMDTNQIDPEYIGKTGKFFPYKYDATNDDEVYQLFAYIKTNFKSLNVCINNAGRIIPKSLLDSDPSDWRKVMELNVIASCLCTQLSIKLMRELGTNDGYIIDMNSQAGQAVQPLNPIHFYAASKFATKALAEGFRQELKALNSQIRISSISPGFIKTALSTSVAPPPQFREAASKMVPLEMSDISRMVIQLITNPLRVEVQNILVKSTEDIYSRV